jgi:hypothetical protein
LDGSLAQQPGVTFTLLRESEDRLGQGHSNRIVPIYPQLAYATFESVNEGFDLVRSERAIL